MVDILEFKDKWTVAGRCFRSIDDAKKFRNRINRNFEKWEKYELHLKEGTDLGEKGNYDDAISKLRDAIEYYPLDEMAYFRRGCIYLKKDEYFKAIKDFSWAIRFSCYDVVCADYYSFRAHAYQMVNMYDEAKADENKANEQRYITRLYRALKT